jgi:Spy/CpxP family protein refolding chaperone
MGCRHRPNNPEERAAWVMEKVSSKLELTETQKPKLVALKDEVLAARKDQQAGREADFDEVVALLSAKELDRAKVNALGEKRIENMKKHLPTIVDRVADLHATLSDKQKATAIEFLKKMRDHWK